MTKTQDQSLVPSAVLVLHSLASECEAAEARDQRGLLKEAYRLIFGGPECIPIDQWPGYKSPRWDRFHGVLNAEAYLDAAMTLVPEGWSVQLVVHPTRAYADVFLLSEKRFPITLQRWISSNQVGEAASVALALCAASLRARSQS